jgi:uncharacterized protein (DUF2249 family)
MNQHLIPPIDVRPIPRPLRHALVFSMFDQLAPRTALELVSDHDPRPLRYLFDVKRDGEFDWAYLENGPQVWRVRIGKRAARDIVAAVPL